MVFLLSIQLLALFLAMNALVPLPERGVSRYPMTGEFTPKVEVNPHGVLPVGTTVPAVAELWQSKHCPAPAA